MKDHFYFKNCTTELMFSTQSSRKQLKNSSFGGALPKFTYIRMYFL